MGVVLAVTCPCLLDAARLACRGLHKIPHPLRPIFKACLLQDKQDAKYVMIRSPKSLYVMVPTPPLDTAVVTSFAASYVCTNL